MKVKGGMAYGMAYGIGMCGMAHKCKFRDIFFRDNLKRRDMFFETILVRDISLIPEGFTFTIGFETMDESSSGECIFVFNYVNIPWKLLANN